MNGSSFVTFVSVLWKIMETVKLVALTLILSTRIWYVNRSYKKCRLYISMIFLSSLHVRQPIGFFCESGTPTQLWGCLAFQLTESSTYVQPVMYELCIKYTTRINPYCFICWSLYVHINFHILPITSYRFYINNGYHDYVLLILSRFLKGNKQRQQTYGLLGVRYLQLGTRTRGTASVTSMPVARHQSGLSPHGSVPMIAIWPKNITFPALGPMSYPYRRMQPSLLELKWCFMTGNPKSDFFRMFQDVFIISGGLWP